MQALTVMLLELAQRTSHLSENPSHLIACVENLVEWLKMMRSVDRVAESAYNVVCGMLSNHKHFASNLSPSQPLQGFVQQQSGQDPFPYPATSGQAPYQSNPQRFTSPIYSTIPFSDNIYNNLNEENLDLNTLAEPLDDPLDGVQDLQTPYPPFHGNQFSTLFDQEMDYDLGPDSASFEGWDPMSEQSQQRPPQ
jgi:hypothetical protein